MPIGTIVLLGAFAGLTIFLGLPLAFLKNLSSSLKAFLGMLATGVLIFLLYDVVSKSSEPIVTALSEVSQHHTGIGAFSLDVLLFVVGIGLGSVGLVYFNKYFIGRLQKRAIVPVGVEVATEAVPEPELVEVGAGSGQARKNAVQTKSKMHTLFVEKGELSPQALALLIATGIGLHNFSEGLAIGQSAVSGELQLALVLIIGFGLHNMTEGFGIAGPLTAQLVSWRFIVLVGLIGGAPTFIGTIVGMIFNSPQVFILFLALAAGAILYVIVELLGVAKRFRAPEIVMWGLLVGFMLGYATDLIVTYAGA